MSFKNKKHIKLNEQDLKTLLNTKFSLKKSPDSIKEKVFNFIDNFDNNNIKKERKPFLNLSFNILKPAYITSFAILFLLILTTFYFIKINYVKSNIIVKAVSYEGNTEIKRGNEYNNINKFNNVIRNDIVKTQNDSAVNLTIGENTHIKLSENTKIQFTEISEQKNNQNIEIFLDKGKINCEVKLATKNSSFFIKTNYCSVSVTGTKFSVEITGNKCNVFVKEGNVNITKIIKTDLSNKIKTKNIELQNQLDYIINKKITLKENNLLSMNIHDLSNLNTEFNNIVNKISTDKTKNIQNEIKKLNELNNKIENNIIKISDKQPFISNNKDKSEDKINNAKQVEYNIKRIRSSENIHLNEKNTLVTSFKENILIASNLNKTIYYINIKNGKLLWKYTDKNLPKITANILINNNEIILPATDTLFIIDQNGNLKTKIKLENSILNWAVPVKYKENIFIPTTRNIYKYNGKTINKLENYPETNGQIFISLYNDSLLCINLNEKILNSYSLTENKITWSTDKFESRVFHSPFYSANYVYFSDIDNKIYLFDYNLKNKKPIIINTETGILSNIIYDSDCFYFIGNNGYFYKYKSFEIDTKVQVDIKPDKEKYFTKDILKYKHNLYFASDDGFLFIYNLINNKYEKIDILKNKNQPFIASPVLLNNSIFLIDSQANIYKIVKN